MGNVVQFPVKDEKGQTASNGRYPAMEANPYFGTLDEVKYRTFYNKTEKVRNECGVAADANIWHEIYTLLQSGDERTATLRLRRTACGLELGDAREAVKQFVQELEDVNENEDLLLSYMKATQDEECFRAFFEQAEPKWREYNVCDEDKWEIYLPLYKLCPIDMKECLGGITYLQCTTKVAILLRRGVSSDPLFNMDDARKTAAALIAIMEELK